MRLLHGFPAAAHGFVEGDGVVGHGSFADGELFLEPKERSLGVKHVVEVGESGLVLIGGGGIKGVRYFFRW